MIGTIFTVARALAGRVFNSGGADILGKVLNRNTAGTLAEASVKKEEIKAGRDVAIAQVRAGEKSWKDEFALFLVAWPYAMLFFIGTWGAVDALIRLDPELALRRFQDTIQHLSAFPGWYTWGVFVPALCAALGIRAYAVKQNGNGNHVRTSKEPDQKV